MRATRVTLLALLILAVMVVIGVGLPTLWFVVWSRRYREPVAQLVRDGEAEWAALAQVQVGAAHFGGEAAPRGSRASGIMSVKDGVLTWRPNARAARKGHVAVTRPLAELRVLGMQRRRMVTGLRYRWLYVAVAERQGVVALLHVEAGDPPDAWLHSGAPGWSGGQAR